MRFPSEQPMIHEQLPDPPRGQQTVLNFKAEILLLFFIIIFGIIGLCLCFLLEDNINNDVSYNHQNEVNDQTISILGPIKKIS